MQAQLLCKVCPPKTRFSSSPVSLYATRRPVYGVSSPSSTLRSHLYRSSISYRLGMAGSRRNFATDSRPAQTGHAPRPVFALVKEYVIHASSADETVGIVQKSSVRGEEASTSSTRIVINETESENASLVSTETVKGGQSEAMDAKHESLKVLVAAPPDLEHCGLIEGAHFVVTTRVSEPRVVVQLESGSQGEHIVRSYGLAALSYHQALDIVCEANGLQPAIRLATGKYAVGTESVAHKPQSGQTVTITEHILSSPSRPSFLVKTISSIGKTIASAFLPTGYPDTVSSDYAPYYRNLFLHNVAGSFSYVMSMTALLQAVGISSGALGAAAAVSWVMKDGLGAIGMIFAAKVLGDANTFDANTIRSKFRADVVHNMGVALELITVIFPGSFLLLASGANTLKGVAGLVSGACKASINQRMAIANNLGDLTAKGHVQGLAAYLSGLCLGVLYDRSSSYLLEWVGPSLDRALLSIRSIFHWVSPSDASTAVTEATNVVINAGVDIPSPSATALVWCLFLVSAGIHLLCSYRALRSLALPSLNQSRTHLLIEKYLQANPVLRPTEHIQGSERDDLIPSTLHAFPLPASHDRGKLPTPFQLAKEASERIVMPELLDAAPKIILGASVSRAFKDAPEHLQPIVLKSLHSPYIIHGDAQGSYIYIVLSSEANSRVMLKAFFHACTARSILLSEDVGESIWTDSAKYALVKTYVDREYPYLEAQLQDAGWRLDQILLTPKPFRADWTLSGPASHQPA